MDHQTRLEKNRSGRWEIRWTEPTPDGRGRTRAVSTRTTDRSIAEAVRRNFLRAEAHEAARAGTGGGTTLGALLDGYEKAFKARGVGPTQSLNVRHLRDYFASLTPDEITPETVLDYCSSRGVSNSTLRRELAALVATLRWAAKHRMIAHVPAVDLPPDGPPRAVFLDEKIEAELWALAAADVDARGRLSRIGRFICLGLETGARKSAIEGLTWDRVDMVRGLVDFRDPGLRVTKKRRVATPISARLLPVLQRAAAERRPRDTHVLDHDGDVRKSWATFMDRHGFEDVTPHVLRHTRITLLLRAGVPVWDVSALVGASPTVIDGVYGHHVADERLRAQANRRFVPPPGSAAAAAA